MSKVLFLSTAYAPEPVGSAPVVADMAEWMNDKGWDVQIATVRPNYPKNEIFEDYRDGKRDEETLKSVKVSRKFAPPPKGGGIAKRLAFELMAFLQTLRIGLRRENRTRPYLISVCPSIFVVLSGWLLSGGAKRHVVLVHDIQSGLAKSLSFTKSSLVGSLIEGLERFLFNRADHLVVLTESMLDTLKALKVTTPATILPPHIDETLIHPLDVGENEVPVLLYSGNIGRKQGLDQLLDLSERLDRKGTAHRLIIRGQGNNRDELEEEARTRGLNHIVFEDFVPKEALNESMAAADIHLVPQLPEGADFAVPSKIYAIMSAGKACIATAHENSPLGHLADQSKGFVTVPPGDAEAFASCVIALLGDREGLKAMGASGREYIVKTCSRDQVMNAFEQCLLGPSFAKVDERTADQGAAPQTQKAN